MLLIMVTQAASAFRETGLYGEIAITSAGTPVWRTAALSMSASRIAIA